MTKLLDLYIDMLKSDELSDLKLNDNYKEKIIIEKFQGVRNVCSAQPCKP